MFGEPPTEFDATVLEQLEEAEQPFPPGPANAEAPNGDVLGAGEAAAEPAAVPIPQVRRWLGTYSNLMKF